MNPNFYDLVVLVAGDPSNDLESFLFKFAAVVLGILFLWSIFFLIKMVADVVSGW